MDQTQRPLIVSLKPRYADLVFSGEKKVELRRRMPQELENRQVFVYVSRMRMAVCGGFRIGNILRGAPDEIWEQVAHVACLDRESFDAYYADVETACALEITDVWEFESPIDLNTLRKQFGSFVAPQSWRYANDDEREEFHRVRHSYNGNGRY